MKMIFRISCIILLTYSNLLSQSNYFPTKIGNYWNLGTSVGIGERYIIFDTMTFDYKLYYLRTNWSTFSIENKNLLLENTDLSLENTNIDSTGNVTIMNNGIIFNSYKLKGNKGDVWSSGPGTSNDVTLISTDDTVTTNLGTFTNCRKYFFNTYQLKNCYYWLAPDIGMINHCEYGIIRARINGKYYPKNIRVRNGEDYERNYYPLCVGNYWIYQKGTSNTYYVRYVIDSFYTQGKLYYKVLTSNLDIFRLDENRNVIFRYMNEYVYYKFNAKVGESWDLKSRDGIYPLRITLSSKKDSVKTIAGIFTNCYRFYLDNLGIIDEEMIEWFAPEVGLVKSKSAAWGVYDELIEAKINDVKYPQINSVKDVPSQYSNFTLSQNYPNPFNPSTIINYTIGANNNSPVQLIIYDVLGKEIKQLVNNYHQVGSFEVRWDGTNQNGLKVPSGMYLYKLKANGQILTKKLLLIK